MTVPKSLFCLIPLPALVLGLLLIRPTTIHAAEEGARFATPEGAVSALLTAASNQDTNALRILFGAAVAEVENPDRVQAASDLAEFSRLSSETNRIIHLSDSRSLLVVGQDDWPFAIPLTLRDGQWFFDTEAGAQELLNRRIGKNELLTLDTVRAYVAAQRDYALNDRDGDGVLEFAERLRSRPGMKDGLYWAPDLDSEISPLGPLVAEAQGEGYDMSVRDEQAQPVPFHGYFFKILTRQGSSAPGGAYNYRINGHMIGGFALVAWPAEYGESGIMTFIVNQQGRVYQKDLRPRTEKVVRRMKAYDPDKSWSVSHD